MPEPVVIIGPADGPAGPMRRAGRDGAAHAPAADTGIEPERRKGKQSMLMHALARLGSGLLGFLVRALSGRRHVGHGYRPALSTAFAGRGCLARDPGRDLVLGDRRPPAVANQITGKSSAALKKDTNNTASTPDAKNTSGSPADGAASRAKSPLRTPVTGAW